MASNFRILLVGNRKGDRLRLKLEGDFDENTAHKLISSLKMYGDGFKRISIDTDDLKITCSPAGDILQKKSRNFKKLICNLIFAGEKLWNQSFLYQWLLWNEAI